MNVTTNDNGSFFLRNGKDLIFKFSPWLIIRPSMQEDRGVCLRLRGPNPHDVRFL